MAEEQARKLLQQGIAAARGGQQSLARELLQQAVRLEPQNETIWLWLSSVAADDKERLFCLKQLLAINPDNEYARKGLQTLTAAPQQSPAADASQAPSSDAPHMSSVPLLDEDRYTRVQQSVDDFLRSHLRHPPGGEIQWGHKSRRRYGEGGAQRLQRATYVSVAAVVLLLIGAGVVAAIVSGVFDTSDPNSQARGPLQVVSATPTATMTATPGGATPTPLPAGVVGVVTAIPSNLERGSIYGNTPTAVYPAPHPNVAGRIETAIELYGVGRYTDALATLEAENASSGQHCYPAVNFYQAMSLIELGRIDEAADLLEAARQDSRGGGGFSACRDHPLVLAGLGYANYLQGDLDAAQTFSQQAFQSDSRLILAVTTLARVAAAQADYSQARSQLNLALTRSPNNVNLLITAAEVEQAAGEPDQALDFVGRALYVDPLSQPALYLQAQTYLQLAQAETNPDQQVAYYGLAVRSAQTMLLYYPGDARGYLYLGQARVGEGNYRQAEQAFIRVLEVSDRLPDDDVISQTYFQRGSLYAAQGRFEEAEQDLTTVLEMTGPNTDVLSLLEDLTLRTGEYVQALDYARALQDLSPDEPRYRLLEARLLVETCTVSGSLNCDYQDMLDLLSAPGFAEGLAQSQRGDALSYRAQARYHVTSERQSLSTTQREAAYRQALSDVNQALALRETVIDHYYRGLLLAELDMNEAALESLQWVSFWNGWYDYPFVDDQLDQQIQALERALEAVEDDEEDREATPTADDTPTPQTETPAPTATEPVSTRVPTERASTPTRTPTPAVQETLPPTAPFVP